MKRILLSDAAEAVSGQLEKTENGWFDSVIIDNRLAKPNSLFVAIKGERFDGHDFVESAFENGSSAVMVSRDIPIDKPYILVDDTRQALLDLARYYRLGFNGTVVGVTGSVGKTTTKSMIAQVLSASYKTLKTQGNLNNEIGLPKTLFGLDDTYGAAVIEMGMSGLGEISVLSKTALPTIGVITNIGVSHIETLGSRENILKAKLEVLEGMEKSAPLVTNGDDDMLRHLPVDGRKILLCGIDNTNCDCVASNIQNDGLSTSFTVNYKGEETPIVLPTVGEHNVMDSLFAYAVGRLSGIEPEKIAEALKMYKTEDMRQNIHEIGGIYVMEDCYNASPDSMQAAVSALMQIPTTGRRIAVLGDMLELGEISAQSHYEVGEMVKNAGINILFCYGQESAKIAEGAEGIDEIFHFDDKEKLSRQLKNILKKGDAVLFKASRGMRLEEVIQKIWE